MKRNHAPRPWALATVLLAPVISLLAAEDPVLRVKLENPQPSEKNRFGLNYRMSFNITVEYRNVGNLGSGAGRHGPPTGSDIDRVYDDGYNRSIGRADNLTWNWAYRNQEQVAGDTLVMRSSSVAPISSKTIDNDPQHGAELTYNRELGRSEKHNFSWGIESGLGWTYIDILDDRQLSGGVRTIVDTYTLGIDPSRNIIAPGSMTPAPVTVGEQTLHPGTAEGPGPLINNFPLSRSKESTATGALIRGERRFEANLFALRLGPYIDWPIDDRWTFSMSAGPAVGIVDGEFRFRQTVKTPTRTTFQGDSGSDTDFVYGGYVSALFRCAINEQWGVFVGGQYTGLSDYEVKAAGQKAEIDFTRIASFTFGATFSF